MTFFGKYLEVTPPSRLVWTNEEGTQTSITKVTFVKTGGTTQITVHELYPSKEALDAAIASGSTGAYPEQFEELDRLLGGAGSVRPIDQRSCLRWKKKGRAGSWGPASKYPRG